MPGVPSPRAVILILGSGHGQSSCDVGMSLASCCGLVVCVVRPVLIDGHIVLMGFPLG